MRPDWDDYFLTICDVVATRATCDRRFVGSVLVKDNRIIGTGYNGAIPGQPHCTDPEEFLQCVRCGRKEPMLKDWICPDSLCRGSMRPQKGGHEIEDNHCRRVVHAEMNALLSAARLGNSTEGAVIYCNTLPCYDCFKALVTAGIKEVVYSGIYKPDPRVLNYTDIKIRQYTPKFKITCIQETEEPPCDEK